MVCFLSARRFELEERKYNSDPSPTIVNDFHTKHATFSALSSHPFLQLLFKRNMKFTSIIFALAAILGIAAATGSEQMLRSLPSAKSWQIGDYLLKPQSEAMMRKNTPVSCLLFTLFYHSTTDVFDRISDAILWSSA